MWGNTIQGNTAREKPFDFKNKYMIQTLYMNNIGSVYSDKQNWKKVLNL